MAKEPRERRGDPKWDMRRYFVIGVCVFGIVAFFVGTNIENPEKIRALGDLVQALGLIVMPILISYMGISEAGMRYAERFSQPGKQITQTTEVKEVRKVPVDDKTDKPPTGWGVS